MASSFGRRSERRRWNLSSYMRLSATCSSARPSAPSSGNAATPTLALIFTWLGHVGFVLVYYCAMRTLWDEGSGQEVPTLPQHFLIVPIGMVIQAMPLFPGFYSISFLQAVTGIAGWSRATASAALRKCSLEMSTGT